jgi:hypothetical protein
MKNINNKTKYVQPNGANALSLSEAVRAYSDIMELEISTLWKWYEIGYAIMVGRFTTQEFLAKVGNKNKTSVSMATKVARFAEQNASFYDKLEGDKFGSLRLAYEAIPDRKTTKPKSNKKSKTVTVSADTLRRDLIALGVPAKKVDAYIAKRAK